MSAVFTNELKPTRPVLRYHGGKWSLASWIISHFPPHNTYTEVYGGGASVLLQKPSSDFEVYNDLWDEVVNVFRVLRDPAQVAELTRLLELTPYARAELLASREPSADPVEQARRTLVRSWLGVSPSELVRGGNTGFRVAVKGQRGVERGPYRSPDFFIGWQACIPAFTARLRRVCVENLPALEVLEKYDTPKTLHYVDPTYPHDTRGGEKAAYTFEMTDSEHRELARVLHGLRGMVVLSGYACELYDEELFKGWHRVTREAYASGAQKRTEVLWMNDAAVRAKDEACPLFGGAA